MNRVQFIQMNRFHDSKRLVAARAHPRVRYRHAITYGLPALGYSTNGGLQQPPG